MKKFLGKLEYTLLVIVDWIVAMILFIGSVFLLFISVMAFVWMICHAKDVWLYIQSIPHLSN